MGTDVLLLHLSLLLLCGHSVCIMRVCTCAQAVKGPGWGGGLCAERVCEALCAEGEGICGTEKLQSLCNASGSLGVGHSCQASQSHSICVNA